VVCNPLISLVPECSAKQHETDERTNPILQETLYLQAKVVAIPAGFEPATHGVEIRYSIQLSYGTVEAFITLPI
jgi:hypothetical protein